MHYVKHTVTLCVSRGMHYRWTIVIFSNAGQPCAAYMPMLTVSAYSQRMFGHTRCREPSPNPDTFRG